MATKAIVGEKVGMTQVWDDADRVVPVTVLRVRPCRVVQVKTDERDGYAALQVTFGTKKASKLSKPEAGHFSTAGVEAGTRLVELRLDDVSGYEVGQELTAELLAGGERVDVTAVSKGKGTAGPMKRHGFSGLGASHGTHRVHRAPGSIGACATPSRVFRGTRMAGRLGGEKVTTLNLTVVQADAERDLVLVKGAVPGPKGGLVLIRDAVKGVSEDGK
jgi:large subunit ribosomal protein L3